jgi:dolichol kinase
MIPMTNQLALTFIFLVAIFLLLIFNELVYRRLGLKGEITRKFAHFTATLSTVTFPFLFTSHWYILFLAMAFFLLLLISKKGTLLNSIHDIERVSAGSYLLPVAIYITFLISNILNNKFLFILPILILAICDPMAGILGINLKNYNHQIKLFGFNTHKTWLGSGSFLASAFVISVIALYYYQKSFDLKTFWLALGIAVVSTITEMISSKGLDNLFLPLSVAFMLLIFM